MMRLKLFIWKKKKMEKGGRYKFFIVQYKLNWEMSKYFLTKKKNKRRNMIVDNKGVEKKSKTESKIK